MTANPQQSVSRSEKNLSAIYGLIAAMARSLPAVGLLIMGSLFTPAQYGRIAILSALYSILMVASDGGFDVASTIALRTARDEATAARELVAGLVGRAVAIAGCSAVLIGATIVASAGDAHRPIAILGLAVGTLLAASSASGRLTARLRSPLIEARLLLTEKAAIATLWVVISLQWRSDFALVLGVIGGPLFVIALSQRSRQILTKNSVAAWDSSRLRAQASVALPVGLGLLATTLYWRVDILIIGALKGHASAGGYAIAYYPLMALTAIPGAASVLLLRSPGDRSTGSLARIALVAGLAIAAVLTFAATTILEPSLLSAVTPESAGVLRVAALGVPAMFANPFLAMSLRNNGRSWTATRIVLAALSINIVGNMSLIPLLGVTGAAWSSTLTEWFALVSLAVLAWRARTSGRDLEGDKA